MSENLKTFDKSRKKSTSVGEEFIEWAEKYWGLKTKYETSSNEGESCPYEYVKKTFQQKIDEIIKIRLT